MNQVDCNDCPYRFMCHDLGLLIEITTNIFDQEFVHGFKWECPSSRPDFVQMAEEWKRAEKAKSKAERIKRKWEEKWV